MKDYFNKYQLPRDLEVISLHRNNERAWNSFSRAPLAGECVSEHGCMIGALDPDIETFEICL